MKAKQWNIAIHIEERAGFTYANAEVTTADAGKKLFAHGRAICASGGAGADAAAVARCLSQVITQLVHVTRAKSST